MSLGQISYKKVSSVQTLIVGGGLSGLAISEVLETQGHDYMLVEARNRFGGRIKTEYHGLGYFDMGPAWFWPGQPRILSLIDRFGLEKFDQFSKGSLIFEDSTGQVERERGISSMEGAWRLKGGLAELIKTLSDLVPKTKKRLNAKVTALVKTDKSITVSLGNGEEIVAEQVILALPPRMATQINFLPTLPLIAIHSMNNVATWMAGQAKALAVYDKPFWREDGLSGDAMSRVGPMVEMHDASPETGGPYALSGFLGIPPQGRLDKQLLERNVLSQLGRLFGAEAKNPLKIYIKDWAFDSYTSIDADKKPLYSHPKYGMPAEIIGLWDKKLYFAGTEVATQFGGYIEGALEAAESTLDKL
jgi:monoamine oxidase